jgi:hypothetical protein
VKQFDLIDCSVVEPAKAVQMRAKIKRIVELGGHASTTRRIGGRRTFGQVKPCRAVRVPDTKTNIYRRAALHHSFMIMNGFNLLRGPALAKNFMTA